MLVNVPDIARLEQLKVFSEVVFRLWDRISEHTVGTKEIAHESIPDIVVLFEHCDEICLSGFLSLSHDLFDASEGLGAVHAEYKDILVAMFEIISSLALFVSTMVIDPRKVFRELRNQG